MNNKKNKSTLLDIIKRHIVKKRVLLLLPLCLALVSCEKESSDKTASKQVELLRPYHALAVNLEDEELIVVLNSFVKTGEGPVEVTINGVPCYPEQPNHCKLNYNKTSNSINAKFSALQQAIVQGENTLSITNSHGQKETLGFTYDNQKPRLYVDKIELNDGVTSPTGELPAGAKVDISFKISDPSDIKRVEFYQGSKRLYPNFFADFAHDPSFECEKADFTQECEKEAYLQGKSDPSSTGSNLHLQQWEAGYNSYLDDLGRKEFELKEVTWPEANDASQQFRYKIEDVHGQKSEGTFTTNGSTLAKSQAIQLNNTLFQHIAPVVNLSLSGAVNTVNTLREYLERSLYTDLNKTSKNRWVVNGVEYWPFFESMSCNDPVCGGVKTIDVLNAMKDLDGQVAAFCGALGWGNASTCNAYVHFDKIRIINPKVTVRGQNGSPFDLKLGIHTAEISAPITVFTLDGRSEFRTTLSLKDFEVYSNITVALPSSDSSDNALVSVKRSPIGLYLIPNLFGNKQVYFLNSSCTGPHCNIVTDFLEPVYNLRLNKQARAQADKMLYDIERTFEEQFVKRTQWPPETPTQWPPKTSVGTDLPPLLKKLFIDPQQLVSIVNKRAHILNKAPRNVHFGFDTKVALQALEDGRVQNPSLGLEAKGNGSYGPVKNANFPSYYAGSQGSLIDFAYAISEDSVNQMLLSEFQSKNIAEITISPSDSPSDQNIPVFGDTIGDVCLKVEAQSAPTVQFHGYYSQKVSVDASFTDKIAENAAKEQAKKWQQLCQEEYGENATQCEGIEHSYQSVSLIDTSKESVPSSISLHMDKVLLSAWEGNCDYRNNVLAEDVEVAISNRLTVMLEGSKPVIKPYARDDDSFVIVRAKHAEDSEIASKFAKTVEAHVNKELIKINKSMALLDPISLEDTIKGFIGNQAQDSNLIGFVMDKILDAAPTGWRGYHYGLKFLSFHVEPSGGYLSLTGKVDVKTITNGNSCTDEGYFRYFCVVK